MSFLPNYLRSMCTFLYEILVPFYLDHLASLLASSHILALHTYKSWMWALRVAIKEHKTHKTGRICISQQFIYIFINISVQCTAVINFLHIFISWLISFLQYLWSTHNISPKKCKGRYKKMQLDPLNQQFNYIFPKQVTNTRGQARPSRAEETSLAAAIKP